MKTSLVIARRLNEYQAISICIGTRVIAVIFGTGRLRYIQPERRWILLVPRRGIEIGDTALAFWIDEIDVTPWRRHLEAEAV